MIGEIVERPNKDSNGTLSGHAAGEPFEKKVYHLLKGVYPNNIFKQYEYLNDLYLRNPKVITKEARFSLFQSPTVLFLLSRGDKETSNWSPLNVFEEKQNDTADIIYHTDNYFDLIDVKTRNIGKKAQAPNIISAYKLAEMCSKMIDNKDFDSFRMHYVEVDWSENGDSLLCRDIHHGELFKENPNNLYINWAAAMQIQFHVVDLHQDWTGNMMEWAEQYLRVFVYSAKSRCETMVAKFITPFLKYFTIEEQSEILNSLYSNNATEFLFPSL